MGESMRRMANRLFTVAIEQGREGELLTALFNGGSATVTTTGDLVIIDGEAVQSMMPDD